MVRKYSCKLRLPIYHHKHCIGGRTADTPYLYAPCTTVKEIVDQLIAKGFVSGRPSLGIAGEEVPAAYRHFYGLPAGFLIAEVTKGGSADTAGIEAGDILLGLDGKRITTAEELETVLYALDAGDTVQAVIYRDHKQLSVTLTLGEAGK